MACEYCELPTEPCKECYREDKNGNKYPIYHCKRCGGLTINYTTDKGYYLADFEFREYNAPVNYCPWCGNKLETLKEEG